MRLRIATAAVLLAAAVTGGCEDGGGTEEPPPPSPSPPTALAGCEELTAPPAAAPTPPPTSAPAQGERLPAMSLPCVSGGEPVALERLAGPAVVNLWASWCGPCRDELPVLQRYADRAGGRVHVVGVVTEDSRTNALWFAHDAGVSFPSLQDEDGRLRARTVPVTGGLPATLFVDADGYVRHLHNRPLDEESLADLAAQHLGVVLP